MSVVVSLLRAIDRADGEALVMHVGEKPYVVTPTGHADLAPKPLTIPAMNGMLEQLLPDDSRQALEELGAVEYHLPPQEASPNARYSVVAARGGDDIWIELRRRKDAPAEPDPVAPSAPAAPERLAEAAPEPMIVPPPLPVSSQAVAGFELETFRPVATIDAPPALDSLVLREPVLEALDTFGEVTGAPEDMTSEPAVEFERVATAAVDELVSHIEAPLTGIDEPVVAVAEFEAEGDVFTLEPTPEAPLHEAEPATDADVDVNGFEHASNGPKPLLEISSAPSEFDVPETEQEAAAPIAEPAPVAPVVEPAPVAPAVELQQVAEVFSPPAATIAPPGEIEAVAAQDDEVITIEEEVEAPVVDVPLRAAVVPMSAPPPRVEAAPRPRGEGLPYLLQVAAAQGASVLYVAPQAKPSLRVDGEIRVLDQETPLGEAQLESAILAMLPAGAKISLEETETCDVPEVGRVQVLGFRDHRGLGAMFKMLPARAISAEQMGLGAAIQSLCTETEGLILVAGARNSGKSTLVAALVDQINRTRRDHVITIEHQIQYVHENRTSFVSQREARDEELFAAWVRSALREAPDVLVVDQVMSPEAAASALHAASNGHLVIASVTAGTTPAALTHFIDLFGEHRADARVTLSEHLRGVITQTLLRKTGGGRAAAREVLVNVPSVATLVGDGGFDQLAAVLNGGRRVGMVPLNDALLGLVQAGSLDVREAYRKSPDQNELVTMFNRAGLDTTFAERLA